MKTELTLTQLAAIGAGAAQFAEGKPLIGNLTVHPTRSGYAGDQPFREAFARAVRDAVLNHIVDPDKMKTPEICLRPDCGVGVKHYEGSHPACTAKAADPYAELKAAHAEGKVIQWQSMGEGPWEDYDPRYNGEPGRYESVKWRIKPETSTFEAHGKTWARHTPGDAMPCDGEARVEWMTDDELKKGCQVKADFFTFAKNLAWRCIIGWRYADEQPTLETPVWTPAVGDVVRLKSTSPKMTVISYEVSDNGFWCAWFHKDGCKDEAFFPQACLTLVTK